MNSKTKFIADTMLLFVTMVWGSSFVLMKNTVSNLNPVVFLCIRFTLAWVIVLILFWKNLYKLKIIEIVYGSIIGFFLFIGMLLQVIGLKFTYASKSAFITGLTVVLVPLFVSIVDKKLPKMNVIVGVTLAFAGLWLLSGAKFSSFNFGDFLTLLADLGFVFQIIFIDKFTSKNNVDPINIAFFQLVSASFLYFVATQLFSVKLTSVRFDAMSIITILITGILGTALAFTVQVFVQRYTTPIHTALIFSAEPVFGVIFSAIIPSGPGNTVEILPLISYVGCGLILLGMIIAELDFIKIINAE